MLVRRLAFFRLCKVLEFPLCMAVLEQGIYTPAKKVSRFILHVNVADGKAIKSAYEYCETADTLAPESGLLK